MVVNQFSYYERSKVRVPKASSWSARKTPSACIYENRRQRKKSFKIIVDTSEKKYIFLFVCPESISKVDPARSYPIGSDYDAA